MESIAAECKKQRHHPEWANVYNRVHVRWTTHSPPGLGTKDLMLAHICDDRARHFDEESFPAVPLKAAAAPLAEGNDIASLADAIASCDVCSEPTNSLKSGTHKA
jgi:hypothetical protein